MYLMLLIICVFADTVKSEESSDEEKFIDLLPEEEKNAFIESVARRLINGIDSRVSQQKSNEVVSEELLDQHSEYVNKILKEETRNLRREGKHYGTSKLNVGSDEDLKVQTLDKRNKEINVQDDEDKNHVDLTLRQGNRRKRNEEEHEQFIPVQTIYDDATNRPEESVKTEINEENQIDENVKIHKSTENSDEHSSKEDIQVRGSRVKLASIKNNNLTDPVDTKINEKNIQAEMPNKNNETLSDSTTINSSLENVDEKEFIETTTSNAVVLNTTVIEVDTKHVTEYSDANLRTDDNKTSHEQVDSNINNATTGDILNKNESVETPESTIGDTDFITSQPLFEDNEKDNDTNLRTDNNSTELDPKYNPDNESRNSSLDINKSIEIEEVTTDLVTSSKLDYVTEHLGETTMINITPDKNDSNNDTDDSSNTAKDVDNMTRVDTTTVNLPLTTTDSSLIGEKDVTNGNSQTNEENQFAKKNYSSNVLNNENILRTYIKNNKNFKETHDFGNNKVRSDNQYIQFENVPQGFVLTTENYDQRSNNIAAPKYSLLYSKYVPQNAQGLRHEEKGSPGEQMNKEKEPKDAEEKTQGYESQSVNLEKIATALRQGVSEKDIQRYEVRPTLFRPSGDIKEYLVYEIPADETPFVAVEPERVLQEKEEPYYVPTYNYAPNNAYYNAYNRLGPNDEKEDEIISNKDDRDDSNYDDDYLPKHTSNFYIEDIDGHRKFKFNNKKVVNYKSKIANSPKSFGLPFVVKRPKLTEIYFNPDEYLDIDYYFERSRAPDIRSRKRRPKIKRYEKPSPFPNSDEDLHPYNNMMRNKAKSHLNAVRQMLYQHQIFGFVGTTGRPVGQAVTEDITASNSNKTDNDNQEEGDNDKDKDDSDESRMKFRANADTDYIILLPDDGRQKNDYSKQKDNISTDYYFGLYDQDKPGHYRYEDILRDRKEYERNKNKEKGQEYETILDLINAMKGRRYYYSKRKRAIERMGKVSKENDGDKQEEWKSKAGKIRDILHMGNTIDAFKNLEMLQALNLTLMRRRTDEDVQVYLNVLKDMVQMNNRALAHYNWLQSTVDVLGAVKKLQYLTKQEHEDTIHPSDLQLLYYVKYLFAVSRSTLEDLDDEESLRSRVRSRLPRNKHREKKYLANGLIDRVWLYIRHSSKNISSTDYSRNDLKFLEFLDDLSDSLFDLYNAIKHIAMVSKYKHQNWLPNLKSLYLKRSEKKGFLKILLHLFTSRLLELIEDNVYNGADEDYVQYIENHEKEVERTTGEFMFVLKLIKEIENEG